MGGFFHYWMFLALVANRLLAISLPIFAPVRDQALMANLSVGLLSDLSLACAYVFTFEVLRRIPDNKWFWRALRRSLVWGVVSISIFGMISAMRYIEHFGMSVRPYHIFSLKTGGLQGAGLGIVLESVRTLILIIVPLGVAYALALKYSIPRFSPRGIVLVLLGYVCLNVSSLQLKNYKGVHRELRYNWLSSLLANYNEFKRVEDFPLPEPEKLFDLRKLFGEERAWSSSDPLYPIWQGHVNFPKELRDSPEFNLLRRYIMTNPPKNVVLVLLESAVAQYISAIHGGHSQYHTPYIDKMIHSNLLFSETFASGAQTKDGQIASLCSLYSIPEFPLMSVAPMTNATCLGDVFAEQGYSTAFFHSADNRFDNKDVFHQHHSTSVVLDGQDFDPKSSRGGWGYSDHALFNLSIERLGKLREPFFSTILTLTNHPPFVVPQDAPAQVREAPSLHHKIIRYADWAFGKFYEDFFARFPNSILVMMSDQGISAGIGVSYLESDYEQVKRLNRMPWIIAAPDLPKPLRGVVFNHRVSNVDLPPTLLNLYGIDTGNQFMGTNAFVRKTPIYINWFNELIRISPNFPPEITQVDPLFVDYLGALGHYNRLKPKTF
jgi:hypothetical protein